CVGRHDSLGNSLRSEQDNQGGSRLQSMSHPTETQTPKPVTVPQGRPLTAWKRFRFRLEAAGAKILVQVIPLFPRNVVHRLGSMLGWFAYYLLRTNRKIALANLDLAFGDSKSPGEKTRIARVSCQTFAATLLTLFWSPRMNRQALDELAETEGLE